MIHYHDDTITLHHGDALEVARELPTGSVDCIVTSPPYYGLRDYGSMYQYGLEDYPEEYVQHLVDLFRELRRVLADDGTVWLNLGDSYGRGSRKDQPPDKFERAAGRAEKRPDSVAAGQPPKSLLGIPWRVALALQEDGWVLRNDIIWAKPNGMPESVTDRLAGKHEHIFLLAKRTAYWFDLDAVREPYSDARDESRKARNPLPHWKENSAKGAWVPPRNRSATRTTPYNVASGAGSQGQLHESQYHPNGKNPGDVWSIPTTPFPGAHFATFPQELARRCIVAGCKPGGVVLDPFSGSGTTGLVAQNNGRRYVGIDTSADYLDLSLKTRLSNGVLDFSSVTGQDE